LSQANTWSQHRYRVQSSVAVTPVIRELWLMPVREQIIFRAGQYVLLSDVDWRVPQRSYSVANAPRADGAISILVTRVQGGPTSTWSHALETSDEVLLEGPFGTFMSAADRRGPALLLGAGSGLAPVRALAEDLIEREPRRPITLFFSCRTRADLIDAERFERWQRERAGFRYLHTLTRDPGVPRHARIPALLADCVGRDLAGWEVFTSGPSGFVVGCSSAAQALGALATDIHTEEFFTDPQPWLGDMPPVPAGGNTTQETS
jgi:CDP-4-dehydro-6-deoxyglucose reductase